MTDHERIFHHLRQIQRSASFHDIAERLGMNERTVSARLSEMNAEGIVRSERVTGSGMLLYSVGPEDVFRKPAKQRRKHPTNVCGDKRGTVTGARRHRRAKEKPCADCLPAERKYMREYMREYKPGWRARNPQTKPKRIEAILTDLIDELRERFGDESMPTFDDWTHMRRGVLADAKVAEARLREVTQ